MRRVLSAGLSVDPDSPMLGDEEFPIPEAEAEEPAKEEGSASATDDSSSAESDEKEL